jgi:hypothetical protein
MTNKNGPDDKAPGTSGREQRPYATLDLKANEIPSEDEKARVETAKQGPEPAKDQPRLSGKEPEKTVPPGAAAAGGSLNDFLTHMAAGLVGAILALIFGFWIFSGDGKVPSSGLAQQEADALRAQLSQTDERIAALEGDLKKAAAKANETAKLQQSFAALAERMAAVETRPAGSSVTQKSVQQSIDPIATRLADIDQRLSALAAAQKEKQVSGKSMAVSLAFYNLQQAVREGQPFEIELKSVADTSPVSLDLAVLEQWRADGVLSLEQLRQSFETAEKAAIDAENQPADESVMSQVWSRARSFVRIRRKGDVPGDETDAILARVKHHLQGGNLTQALGEAEKVTGPAAETLKPWIASLKRKIAVEDTLAQVEATLLSALGGENLATRGG